MSTTLKRGETNPAILNQGLILCRQKQWTSGKCKDDYCRGCEDQEQCYELLGK